MSSFFIFGLLTITRVTGLKRYSHPEHPTQLGGVVKAEERAEIAN